MKKYQQTMLDKNSIENNKVAGYARVSSADQKDGYSLDSQSRLFKETAQKNGTELVKEFIIDESASGRKVRKIFTSMFDYLRDNDIHILYGEKVDRLTRNPKEVLLIQEWIEEDERNKVIAILENLTIHKYARSHDIFVWDIKVATARLYANNLSEESRKGIKEKILQGLYHGAYKPGYKTIGEKGKRILVPNENTFSLWQRIGKDYMSGEYTMKKLVQMAADIGLRSRYGKKIYKSQIESFLKDPFYHGVIIHNGEVANPNGKHVKMRSKEEFDVIQEIRIRRKSPFYTKHGYLFSKMIGCGECNGTVTSEIQKGSVYCHCNHYRGCTQKGGLREDSIESKLIDLMRVFESITDEESVEIARRVRENHQEEIKYKNDVLNNLEGSYRGLQNKIDRLYDDRLSGIVSDARWQEWNNKLQTEQKDIIDQIAKLKSQEASYFELGLNIMELARKARTIYSKRSPDEKRLLLRTMFKTITLKDKEVSYTLTEPVRKLHEKLILSENFFEPKKAFADKAKALSEAKIAMMLLRQGSNLRPIA